MIVRRTLGAVLALVFLLGQVSLAAPLFPDVPDAHWARDAVSALAAKGLVEGYPDGTFKGDRAASRWEVAMIVARLLAKMEQAHATFATKAELEELRKLADALREELDALGVRVTNLEEQTERLDKRVTELERITFYGNLEVRTSFQTYRNSGSSFSDPSDALLDYNSLIGSVPGAGGRIPTGPAATLNFDPFAFGAFTVNNLKTGRPLSNGTAFTSLATLGLNIRINSDLDAGAEFIAFSSQGDQSVGQYYGISPPFLSNAFTALSTVTGGLAGVQATNHRPFTNMTLDHFWLEHKPSKTMLRLGSIEQPHFDTIVYQKQYNPGNFGEKYLDGYGIQV
ncbi:MAG: S-layer homology domain-containing protein, partial [Candidatus Eremiobacteraeota bacterium]|nr:S-layer homology domain-containing protein [Candidatus Eremiobacteraeota bacterium]